MIHVFIFNENQKWFAGVFDIGRRDVGNAETFVKISLERQVLTRTCCACVRRYGGCTTVRLVRSVLDLYGYKTEKSVLLKHDQPAVQTFIYAHPKCVFEIVIVRGGYLEFKENLVSEVSRLLWSKVKKVPYLGTLLETFLLNTISSSCSTLQSWEDLSLLELIRRMQVIPWNVAASSLEISDLEAIYLYLQSNKVSQPLI